MELEKMLLRIRKRKRRGSHIISKNPEQKKKKKDALACYSF